MKDHMRSRLVYAIITVMLLAGPVSVAAQGTETEVTLKVPVNLTLLGSGLPKVKVTCGIRSAAIPGISQFHEQSQEILVSGGQVVMTATLVFRFQLENPIGKLADIMCVIKGWSTLHQLWEVFNANAENPVFRTTPSLGLLQSSFTW